MKAMTMKNLDRITCLSRRVAPYLLGLMALLGIGAGISTIHAQLVQPEAFWAEVVQGAMIADDTDVAFIIKYVGAQSSGTVQTSSGDILLKHGAQGAEAADATVTGCGATAGTLDVDNAACDTLGELVDKINAGGNWRAVIVDGLRTDTTAAATLVTMATIAITPYRTMGPYLVGTRLVQNPYQTSRGLIVKLNATTTYASGTSAVNFYSVKVNNNTANSAATSQPGSEIVTQVFGEPGGATTVNKIFDLTSYGIWGKKGEKLVARVENSAAMSAVTFKLFGLVIPERPTPR